VTGFKGNLLAYPKFDKLVYRKEPNEHFICEVVEEISFFFLFLQLGLAEI